MRALAVFLLLFGLAVGGAFLGRQRIRRVRRVRQLEGAEAEVAAAVDDGRLARGTGEALLQHLEGLRRECSSGDGD